jgi:ERF superfamily
MKMSETTAELFTALSVAQGQISAASKSSINPHFKSRYADLNSLRDAIQEAMTQNGLGVIQCPRVNGNHVEVETFITHKSGEYIAETLQMPFARNDAQAIGSALTYCRRYSLGSLLNLSADDDDGNAAVALSGKQDSQGSSKAEHSNIKDEAKKIAQDGTEALTVWWNNLTKESRESFSKDDLAELKTIAAKAI